MNKWAAARGLSLSGAAALKNVNAKANLMNTLTTQRYNQLGSLANLGTMGFASTPNLQGYAANATNLAQVAGQNEYNPYAGLAQLPFNALNTYMMWGRMNAQNMGNQIAGMIGGG
jgi:hypothetical protein